MMFPLLMLAAFACLTLGEEITLKTKKGNVKGVRVDTKDGFYYYSFRGIKYAQAPVDELRFKDPVEVEPYTDDYDATEEGVICPQYDVSSSSPIGDEDCLNLNVYTPRLDGKKRAVMVYIHGGAYVIGGGASYTYGPKFLLGQDVVVVTMNYRLGALGFLATSDEAATGNFGIKDQVMALKWVRDNIAAFGGDPDKVTIFGDDAGAASVSIHLLSPESKGLFRNAIALSGNVLCDQFYQSNPQEAAEELASRLGCTSVKGEDIVDCLRRQTQQDITLRIKDMMIFFTFPRWFGPTVDGRVLPDEPATLLQEGKFNKVPVITGQSKDEGASYYRLIMNTFQGKYNDNFLDHKLPRILPIISSFASKLYPITRHVRKKYFVNVDMENEEEFRPKFNDFITDLMFTRCTNKFVNVFTNASVPVYYYSFDYRGQYSIVNLQGEMVDMGTTHGDEMQYLFDGVWGGDFSMSKADLKFSEKVFAPLLANFAKASVPVPSTTDNLNVVWAPVAQGKNNIFRIGDHVSMEEDFKQDALRFWGEEIPRLFKKNKSTTKKSKEEL